MGIIQRSYFDAAQKGRDAAQQEQGNALLNQQRQQNLEQSAYENNLARQNAPAQADAARAKEFATQMTNAIRYAKGSTNPKALIEKNFPMLVETFGPEWATATDDQVRSELDGAEAKFGSMAGIGPAAQKGTSGAMYKYVDPVSGKPIYGAAEDVRGKTPYREEPMVTPSYAPVQTADGVGAFDARTGRVRPTGVKPPEKPADAPKLTEGDKRARVMLASMQNAEADIGKMNGSDTSSIAQQLLGSNSVTAPLQSDDYRKYESAGLRWAANLLYLKSGATAPPEEVRSTWKQFFPMPGDGEGVKQQKAAARSQELAAVKAQYDPNGAAPPAPATAQQPAQIKSDAEYAALPSGAQYVAPDGSVRRKK